MSSTYSITIKLCKIIAESIKFTLNVTQFFFDIHVYAVSPAKNNCNLSETD